MSNIRLEDLKEEVLKYNKNIDDLLMIERAYDFADYMHHGQVRQSGEDYITHPLNVAYILAQMNADTQTICAALLHDTLEDTKATYEEISIYFNEVIANLVDGVTKISKLNFSSKEDRVNANTRKIITGVMNDVRIIIIKLADRLHNMRTLGFKSEFKQKENAMETMDIFVPFAYYLGAYRIKSELEDLSFKYLYPNVYQGSCDIQRRVCDDSKHCLEQMYEMIDEVLSDKNIPHEIKVRTKNVYGIYKRLKARHNISDIHDLLALKVMVDDTINCYQTLGLVHSKYRPINNKFKDYIANPKTNMYSSLHTTVFGEDDRLVQTQIRTFDMDKVASFGIVAYWNLKKNTRDIMQNDLKNKFQFYNSLVEIHDAFSDNKEFVAKVREELFADKIYVYTTRGQVIELPRGSTAIDFAYKIQTDIGNMIIAAIVNDKLVDANYVLHNKDRVKIITDVKSRGPREEWLGDVQTTKARSRIKEFNGIR